MKLNIILSVCSVFSALVAFGAPDCAAEGSATRPILSPHRGMWDKKVPQNTVEAIRRANSLEGEPKEDQILLIPV